MRYVIGALLGAVIAVLPGIPAFTTWENAQSKPVLFDSYCGVDYWAGTVECPSSRTAFMAGIGALAGLGGVAAGLMRRKSSIVSDTGSHGPNGAPRQEDQESKPDPSDRPRRSPPKSSGDWTDIQRRRPR